MDFYSPDLPKMHFRKMARRGSGLVDLNANMMRLLFAIDEKKNISQVATELEVSLYNLRETLAGLWKLGLIQPVDDAYSLMDGDFLLLLKINLTHILKKDAETLLNQAVEEMGVDIDKIPMRRAHELIRRLSSEIYDPRLKSKFQEFMICLIPEEHAEAKRSVGKTKFIIDTIMSQRAKGNSAIAKTLRTKFMLKGINPDAYAADTPDDPDMLKKLTELAKNLGVKLKQSAPTLPKSVGRSKQILDAVIAKRSRGNPAIARALKTKFMLKGINPDAYTADSPDDPAILKKLIVLAKNSGIKFKKYGPVSPKSTGQIKQIIDTIISQRSKGNPTIAKTLKTKFMLKGINSDAYTTDTPDDPAILKKMTLLAENLGVTIGSPVGSPAPEPEQSTGRIKHVIDTIISQRSKGNPIIAKALKIKFMLKGINSDAYSADMLDDPAMLKKVTDLAETLGVAIGSPDREPEQSTGQIKHIIDTIISQRSKGNPVVAKALKIKFMLKGINSDAYSADMLDDPAMLKKVTDLAETLGVAIGSPDREPEQSTGKIKHIIDTIISQRSKGNPVIAKALKIKLMLKGINSDAYSADTPDDAALLSRLMVMANSMNVSL